MSGSHEKLPWLFWVQLILVAIVGTLYLLAPKAEKHGSAEAEGVSTEVKEAASNLKPVGQVAKKTSAPAGSAKARSGKKVYDTACGACHTAGIANAPKPDDKAAWESRMAQGMDGLMKTAINGKGAMPPRGGNPTVTDEELKAAIVYMTKQAGLDLGSNEAGEKAPSDSASGSAKTDKASSAEAKAAETPAVAKEEKAVTAPPAKPAMAKAPEPAATAPEAPKAPEAPVAAAIATTATAVVAAPVATEKTAVAENTQTKESAPPQDTAAIKTEIKVATKEGEKLYNSMCFSCHATGVADSPKLDDKAAWVSRIAAGYDVLYTSAIKGKGVMPPKGGNMSLSDDAIKAAVDYMVSKVQ